MFIQQRSETSRALVYLPLLIPLLEKKEDKFKALPLLESNLDLINRVLCHSVKRDDGERIDPGIVGSTSQIFSIYDLLYDRSPLREYLTKESHDPGALDKRATKELKRDMGALNDSLYAGADILYVTLTGKRLEDKDNPSNNSKVRGALFDGTNKFMKALREESKKNHKFISNAFETVTRVATLLHQEKDLNLIDVLQKASPNKEFMLFINMFSQSIENVLVSMLGTTSYQKLLTNYFNADNESKSYSKNRISKRTLVTFLAVVSIILASCNSAPAPIVNAESTLQAAIDSMCAGAIERPPQCDQANPLELPDPLESIEDIGKNRSIDTLGPVSPAVQDTVFRAIEKFNAYSPIIQPLIASDADGQSHEIGYDFSGLDPEQQREEIYNLIEAAQSSDTPVEIEIGPGHVLNPCAPGTLCIKTDLQAPTLPLTDTVTGENGQIVWFGDTNFNALDPVKTKADLIFTVSPFPNLSTTNSDFPQTDFVNISMSAVDRLNPNGQYIVVSNPKLSSQFDSMFSQFIKTFSEKNSAVSAMDDTNPGIIIYYFSDGSSIEVGDIVSMRQRNPGITFLNDPRSLFIDELTALEEIKVLIFKAAQK